MIEGEFELQPRQVIVFAGWSLPDLPGVRARSQGRQLDDDPRVPGLAVHWVEIEGPLDPWPPAGYQRLFDGVPLEAAFGRPGGSRGTARAAAARQSTRILVAYDPLVPAPRSRARMPND